MATEISALLDLIGRKAEMRVLSGYFRGFDGLRAVVDFDGGRVPAHLMTDFVPEVNEAVWVQVVDGVAFVVGPATPKPGNGEVVSAVGGKATVSTALGTVEATYDGTLTYTPGTRVKLLWREGAYIAGRMGAAPPPPAIPLPATGPTTRTVTFSPRDSGSWQAGYGWRTSDIWSSANNLSGWFYGNDIRDTIDDAARIDAASIWLPQPERLTGERPFGRHDFASKPGGALTIRDASTLPGTQGQVPIPTALIDYLKSNTGGLGFAYGGWNVWPGVRDSQSGLLTVTFTV